MPGGCELCGMAEAKACCGGCKSVWYCDRQCQVKDWINHKLKCKKLQKQKQSQSENNDDLKQDSKEEDLAEVKKLDMNNFTFTLPSFDTNLIRIEESKTYNGYGMVANCKIVAGTIIHSEKAMLCLPDYAKHKINFYITQQFILLSQTQQNIYKSLSNNNNDNNDNDKEKLLNIWKTNQIRMKERKSYGIFGLLSRVNHDCIGNAHFCWNEKDEKQRLIALCDIDKDTEIVVNYCGYEPLQNNKQRMEKLKYEWNINECKCKLCINNKLKYKMDIIISEYLLLDKSLESLMNKPLDGYKASQKLVKIIEKNFNSNSLLMNKHCYDAAQFALGLQKWSEASYYLETSFKQKQNTFGHDIEIESQFMEKVNLLPTKFRSRFRKFDPKYRAKLNNNKNNKNNKNKDDIKENLKDNNKSLKNGNHTKTNGQKNGKKSNGKNGVKSNGKGKGKNNNNRNGNKSKNNKNKKKKGRK